MKFWDTSAVVPVLVLEANSEAMRELASDGAEVVVWWATPVECTSAIARREREGSLTPRDVSQALVTLDGLEQTWVEVPPRDGLRADARRLVQIHDLRAADALQLAAARAVNEAAAQRLAFVTLDDRLAVAARREGFPILPS